MRGVIKNKDGYSPVLFLAALLLVNSPGAAHAERMAPLYLAITSIFPMFFMSVAALVISGFALYAAGRESGGAAAKAMRFGAYASYYIAAASAGLSALILLFSWSDFGEVLETSLFLSITGALTLMVYWAHRAVRIPTPRNLIYVKANLGVCAALVVYFFLAMRAKGW